MEKQQPARDLHEVDVSTTEQTRNPSQTAGLQGFLRVFAYGRPIDYVLESVGVLAAIGSGVAVALVNLVMGQFIILLTNLTSNGASSEEFMTDVSRLSLYFVYIGIARFALTYVYATLFTYVAFRLTRNIRHSYLRAALSQEVGFFDHGTAGSVSVQANSNGKLIQSGIAEKLGLFVQSIATFIAAFIIAFISHWKLTLIILCVMPALLIVVGTVAVLDSQIETEMLKVYAQAAAYAESILASARAIKAFSLESRIAQSYASYLSSARKLGDKKNPFYGFMFGAEYFVVYAGMGLAYWQGIALISRGEIDNIGTVFTVLFSVIIASTTMTAIAPHTVAFSRAASAASELFVLIDRKSSIDPFAKTGRIPAATVGVIELEGINFSYPTRPDIRVLENFSLNVPAGKVTALVGTSGSGKSTIIGLLERWYDPQAGTIKLDGTNTRDLDLNWMRTTIRLVQQEPVLFNGTVFENIANGLVGTKWETAPYEEQLERVRQAARLAFADGFIMNLGEDYSTLIGERGGLLSGGQKQRIAIARSIISEPKILLLDEATSALDPHAEETVQRALDSASRDRTTIVIAHKLASIRNADNIVVMSAGKIVEQGRHENLIALGGTYANLVKAQNLSVDSKRPSGHISDDDSEESLEPSQSLAKQETAADCLVPTTRDRDDFDVYKGTGLIHTTAKLIRSTADIRNWYIAAAVTCVIGAGMFPGQALLLGKVMDAFSSPDMVQRGNFVALMYFVMGLGCLVVYFSLGWTTNVIAQTLGQRVRRELLSEILKQDLRFFDRPENTTGALTSRIDSHAQAIFELMGFNISLVLTNIVNVLSCSILAIAVSWKLGMVGVFAGMPPMLLSGYARIRIETRMDDNIDRKFSKSASIASESLNAIRTVSSLAIQNSVLQRYTQELDDAISSSRIPLCNMMIWFSLTQSIEYFILALGFWWGSQLLSSGQITLNQFMISFMGVYFSGQAGAQLFGISSSFTKANSAGNYYFWLLGLEPTIQETKDNQNRGPPQGCRSIEFRDTEFSYPLAPNSRVLKGISLTIDPGTFVAFVGASGCGKSTMISLVERFYDPTRGEIVIDTSSPLTEISPRLYRGQLGLVQQEPTLFPGTIRENITAGIDFEIHGDDVSDDRLIEACRAANAWEFVSSLPDGLNTLCGQAGNQLSGGQRQRIAIARALVRKPRVILLDEATSALDTESEKIVQKALKEAAIIGGCITIAVAHRLSTVRDADRICVFYGGRIVESGTHEQLIEQCGMYKKMCEAQSLDRADQTWSM